MWRTLCFPFLLREHVGLKSSQREPNSKKKNRPRPWNSIWCPFSEGQISFEGKFDASRRAEPGRKWCINDLFNAKKTNISVKKAQIQSKLVIRSLASHSFLATASSCAAGEAFDTLHSTKYWPVTPSTSSETAQCIEVWAPSSGV